jgi:phenylacetate-CoA ligase
MALRGGILGRTDDMLLVRGMNVYPPALDDVLRSFPEVAEYQVEIDTRGAMTELAVRIEPMAGRCDDGAALAARVESRIRAAFNLRMPVTLCAAGSLPRPEMKSGRWVRT